MSALSSVRERTRSGLTPSGREFDRHTLGVSLFTIAAGLSFVLSVALWFAGDHDEGLFVGIWVPSILSAGAFWISAMSQART